MGVNGLVRGWVIGALSRVEERDVALDVAPILGSSQIVVTMTRPAPSKLRSERIDIRLRAREALRLGLAVVAAGVDALEGLPLLTPTGNHAIDKVERERVILGAVAAHALATLAEHAGQRREDARDRITVALGGWVPGHAEVLAARAVSVAFGLVVTHGGGTR